MAAIGFSTGCLYREGMSYEKMLNFYKSLGASAVELGFNRLKALNEFEPNQKIVKALKPFDYVSIHAPFVEFTYKKDKKTDEVLDKLEVICKKLPVKTVVMHPDVVRDFSYLTNRNLPIAFENMDLKKTFGERIEDMRELEKYGFGFVLDLQHAYENDSSMRIVNGLIRVMGNKIRQIHISGQTENESHIATHAADNKEAIIKALTKSPKAPIICEGVLVGNINEAAKKELALIAEGF
jgi:phosphopantetheinyl transferase (holo-ACP synthase)